MCLYHTFVLFLWVSVFRNARLLFSAIGLAAITLEGVICVLFSDVRFLPVHGIQLNQLTTRSLIYLVTYLSLLLVILGAACLEMRRLSPKIGVKIPNESREVIAIRWLPASRKILVGLLITALTIAGYSLYCLQFY